MPIISTNTAANTALKYLNLNSYAQGSTAAKIGAGAKIIRASDDAAGLAISTQINRDAATLQISSKGRELANNMRNENTQTADSKIIDADVASETAKLSSAEINTQASVAALSQANQMPSQLLSLLK
jgi:flagellin